MKVLLDTHVVLWWVQEEERLSPTARGYFRDPAAELLVSHASVWEMAIKLKLGKLKLTTGLERFVQDRIVGGGMALWPISLQAILTTASLEMHHSDPFDRLILSESLAQGWPVVSADPFWKAYPAQVVW